MYSIVGFRLIREMILCDFPLMLVSQPLLALPPTLHPAAVLTGSTLECRQQKRKEARLTTTCILNHQLMVLISGLASENEEIKQALLTILNYPCSRTDSPEKNPSLYGQLIFDKGGSSIKCSKNSFDK